MPPSAKVPKTSLRISELIDKDFVSEDALLQALSTRRRSWTRERAASHPCATSAVILKAVNDDDLRVVEAALENKNIDADLLKAIIQPLMDGIPHWPDGYQSNLTEHLDRNRKVQMLQMAISHPLVPPCIIAEAMFHHEGDIRACAARSISLNNPMFALSVKARMYG